MIHLTYVSDNVRGSREPYSTDHAGEAFAKAAAKWYASGGEHPADHAVFVVVIERDDCELSRAEVLREIEQIASMERTRAHNAAMREGGP